MNLETLSLPLEVNDKAFNVGVGAAVAAVTALVAAMSFAVKSTFEWADQLDSIQDVIGGTNTEAAALNFTLRKSGVSTETFNKSMVIMEKGLVKADGSLDTIGKSLDKWGINVKDSNGNLKSQQQLIGEVSQKYGTFATQQEKVNFLTEVFGRGGAEMIDFFDTLSKEGGIDAVTQKVQDLGLVIDPQRYEDFTRNLEEIKLAGLGLAVGLTEKLMPAFESMLAWAQQFQGMTPEQIFSSIADQVSVLPAKFEEWSKNINWQMVSQDIINGINSVDWNGIGLWVGESASHIADGLANIFKNVNWGGIFSSIGTAFMEFSTGLVGSNFDEFKAVWKANWDLASMIVYTSVESAKAAILGWLRSIPGAISNYFSQALNNLKEWIGKMLSAISPLTNALAGLAGGGALSSVTSNNTGSSGSTGVLNTTSKASGGYASGPTWTSDNELINLPSGSYVNNAIASSRMKDQPVQAYIDYDELARTLGRVLGQQMQRA